MGICNLNEVQNNMKKTGYPHDKFQYIIGKVEDTLKQKAIPDRISLLRLDTDWYESTKTELEVLFLVLFRAAYL